LHVADQRFSEKEEAQHEIQLSDEIGKRDKKYVKTRDLFWDRQKVAAGEDAWQTGATLGATPGGHTSSSWGARRPYLTGFSRSHFKVAEREGLSSSGVRKANKYKFIFVFGRFSGPRFYTKGLHRGNDQDADTDQAQEGQR
jgi:hypothetical protein